MKFTIDRSKWRCGGDGSGKRGTGKTELLNNDGFMCCLGQVCEQLGVKRDKLRLQSSPVNVFYDVNRRQLGTNETHFVEKCDGVPSNSGFAFYAMEMNDMSGLTDSEREAQLTKLFAEHGHEIEFVGEFK